MLCFIYLARNVGFSRLNKSLFDMLFVRGLPSSYIAWIYSLCTFLATLGCSVMLNKLLLSEPLFWVAVEVTLSEPHPGRKRPVSDWLAPQIEEETEDSWRGPTLNLLWRYSESLYISSTALGPVQSFSANRITGLCYTYLVYVCKYPCYVKQRVMNWTQQICN